MTDLALLFNHSASWISELIRDYEAKAQKVVPRRGSIHDLGRTVSHKRIICRLAYVEGKLTPAIARETYHSAAAVDNYILALARVYFAAVEQQMTSKEVSFALQQPLYLVEEYIKMIDEFGLDEKSVYDRVDGPVAIRGNQGLPSSMTAACPHERREQEEAIAG